ncbi:hypothetical protein TKK_0013713 [Trichogramma kaykai]
MNPDLRNLLLSQFSEIELNTLLTNFNLEVALCSGDTTHKTKSHSKLRDETEQDIVMNEIQVLLFVKMAYILYLQESIPGQIVLGKYKNDRTIDRSKLASIVIYDKLKLNTVNYSLSKDVFVKLQSSIVELFPTEDPKLLYESSVTNDQGICSGPKGYLYSTYKKIRKQRGLAKIIVLNNKKPDTEENSLDTCNRFAGLNYNNFASLLDPVFYPDIDEITGDWQKTFDDRYEELYRNKKRIYTLNVKDYLRSFPCITTPHGINLLE